MAVNEQKDKKPEMREEEIERARKQGRMEQQIETLQRTLDNLLPVFASMQKTLTELADQQKTLTEFKADVNRKFGEVETQLTQLTVDLHQRRGLSGALNSIGAQSPFWIAVAAVIAVAAYAFFNQQLPEGVK